MSAMVDVNVCFGSGLWLWALGFGFGGVAVVFVV